MSPLQNSGTLDHGDRRSDPRTATRIEAVIDDARYGSLVFTAGGFSRTGAFLQRRDDGALLPPVGDVIPLVFRWPLETRIPPVRVEAKVIRRNDDGVGVQFEITA